jgi:hypothetical protein
MQATIFERTISMYMDQMNIFVNTMFRSSFSKHKEVQSMFDRIVDDYQKQSNNTNIQHINTWQSKDNFQTNNAFKHISESDEVKGFCKEIFEKFDIKQGQSIAITRASIQSIMPGGCLTKRKNVSSFYTGMYFVNSDPDSGGLVIDNPVSEYYYNNIPVENKNPYNSWQTFLPMPEGEIYFVPGYFDLCTTPNMSEKPLNLITFDLEIIKK